MIEKNLAYPRWLNSHLVTLQNVALEPSLNIPHSQPLVKKYKTPIFDDRTPVDFFSPFFCKISDGGDFVGRWHLFPQRLKVNN